jgi:hypothetical protein
MAVLGLKGWRTIIYFWYYNAWYVACLGSYCTHVTWHRGTLKIRLIGVKLSTSTCLFLQWHLVSFPHQLRGGTYADKYGLPDNTHPVSEGWICVVGTDFCLVLRNHSHRLRKGSMLRCVAFWRFGESQTLYKKSVQWECMHAGSDLTPLKQKSSHNSTWTCIFRFHNQWCMWVEFLSTPECEFLLWAVCTVSPCLTGQFVQTVSL